jgi:cation transport regulator ChaB
VYVDDIDERARLERSALFFIPAAFELCRRNNLSVSKLTSRSTIEKKDRPHLFLAGRAVIGTVMGCKQPVVYESAVRFINLANLDLPEDERLQRSDIVACAFRLSDPELVADLGLTSQGVATACGLRKEVVEGALKQMRIPYTDAHAIWAHLSDIVKTRADLPEGVKDVITNRQQDFIRTDANGSYSFAVERIGRPVPRHSKKAEANAVDVAEYVYNRANLHPAPVSGHPWAIQT